MHVYINVAYIYYIKINTWVRSSGLEKGMLWKCRIIQTARIRMMPTGDLQCYVLLVHVSIYVCICIIRDSKTHKHVYTPTLPKKHKGKGHNTCIEKKHPTQKQPTQRGEIHKKNM